MVISASNILCAVDPASVVDVAVTDCFLELHSGPTFKKQILPDVLDNQSRT